VDSSGIVSISTCNDGFSYVFPLAGGGVCPGDTIIVEVEGITLQWVTAVASFDQSGDLSVDQHDLAIVESKIGTADRTADFDGDGKVTSTDLALLQEHLGHHAPDATAGVPDETPSGLSLSRPTPNPFRGQTRFTLTLAHPGPVDVALFDAAGRRVATVFRGDMGAGLHPLEWQGRADGTRLLRGIYFLNAIVDGHRLTQRVVLLGAR
jgi:hypothetical protein